MSNIPLGRADYNRKVAKEARIQTLNRYFESNPVLNDQNAAMIARPGLARWIPVGPGPIRGTYSQAGSFDDALFVVSGENWYRVDKDGTVTLLTIGLKPGTGGVSMVATGTIGTVPEYCYLADGRNLWLYSKNSAATGFLTGTAANNDVINIGGVYYKFTTGAVNAGTPAGTLANPWLVALGVAPLTSWQHLSYALSLSGVSGTDYSPNTTKNAFAQAFMVAAGSISVRAVAAGLPGNAVATTVPVGTATWLAATLTGGGVAGVSTVQTPDDVGIISLGYIASYVVAVPAQGQGINGRFFWIQPGETTIDPLNYATAERSPDPIFQVVVFGDQFWLTGSTTTEVWYFTGVFSSPVLRLQGVTFDRGTWEGTAVQVKESMIIVDTDGGVFQVAGSLKRISNPSIEERIRNAITYQANRIIL